MFEAVPSFRGSIFAALSLAACAFLPSEAAAATARVQWLPSASDPIVRYDVYVRDAGAPYDSPAWSGSPGPAADGALEALVPFSVAPSGTNYFAVVAVGATGESALSSELALGTPVACRSDSCVGIATCDFGNLPNGTSCDVAATDPCGAMCVDGACRTTSDAGGFASDVELDRLLFTQRASGITLALNGRVATDAALDPTSTGAVVELHDGDGTVLYTASVGPAAFVASRSDRRFRFAASHADEDPAWNGLTDLMFRRSGSQWIVTAQAKTPALTSAYDEPGITLVVRLGGTCMRRVGAECEHDPPLALCR